MNAQQRRQAKKARRANRVADRPPLAPKGPRGRRLHDGGKFARQVDERAAELKELSRFLLGIPIDEDDLRRCEAEGEALHERAREAWANHPEPSELAIELGLLPEDVEEQLPSS